MSVGFGAGFEGIVRPFAQRQASGDWNTQIWVAAVRYQRPGPIGLRVDAGLIPSPVGLANLMLRPQLNPTVSLPASLFTALPPVEFGAPRTTLLGAVYPYGASATVSGARWDARAAVIDTSPLRTRRVFSSTNPPRFDNVVVGGGVTPFVGLRVGGSVTHGGWLKAGESPTITEDRDATIVTVESEFSYRYTKLLGEWARDTLETSSGERVASGWFVQGQQTLTPRWFVAGRVERMSALALTPLATVEQQHLDGVEETIGFKADSGADRPRGPSRAPRLRPARVRSPGGASPSSGGSAGCSSTPNAQAPTPRAFRMTRRLSGSRAGRTRAARTSRCRRQSRRPSRRPRLECPSRRCGGESPSAGWRRRARPRADRSPRRG